MTESEYQILRLVVYGIGVPIIAFLLWRIVRKVRAIRELDARLKAEEAARRARGIIEDPNMALARLFAEAEAAEKPKSKRRTR